MRCTRIGVESRNQALSLRQFLTHAHPENRARLHGMKGHSQSSRRVPGYSRSGSRNSKFLSRNTKFHSRNGIPRLEQYENNNSRSNSQSDSRNEWEPTRKSFIFICPSILGVFLLRIGVLPACQRSTRR